ncbi:MAG: DMT family transporter [Pseudomonadota bacterium]
MNANRPVLAAGLMIAGMVLIPVGDTFAKLLIAATPYSVELIAWSRFVVGAALALPIMLVMRRWTGITRWFVPACVLRGALVATAIFLIITSLGTIPLALAFGAFFIGPGVATLLAWLVLREEVRFIEWMSIAFGFVGVLLVVQPGADFDIGFFYALAAGVMYGAFNAATRWTRPVGPPLAQLTGQLLVGALILTPMVMEELTYVELQEPWLLLGSGVASAIGNLLAIIAYGLARAAVLTPLIYTQLVSATALTIWVFKDELNILSLFGLGITLLAGLMPRLVRRKTSNIG